MSRCCSNHDREIEDEVESDSGRFDPELERVVDVDEAAMDQI